MSRLFLLGFALVTLLGFAAPASAQYGLGCYGWGAPYSFYQREYVPYYAIHPPVYYSHIVPRTYGYSPFAYPPGVMTPDVTLGEAQTVTNPYVKPEDVQPTKPNTPATTPSTPAKPPAKKTSVMTPSGDKAARISNPFVTADIQLAQD